MSTTYYFLALEPAQRAQLHRAGIPNFKHTYGNTSGAMIVAGDLKQVLDCLNLVCTEKRNTNTNHLIFVKVAKREHQSRTDRDRYAAFRFETVGQSAQEKIKKKEEMRQEVARLQLKLMNKLAQSRDTSPEFLASQWSALSKEPKISQIQPTQTGLCLITHPLLCSNPDSGEVHHIGAFCLQMTLVGDQSGIRFYNLTRRVKAFKDLAMQAPYILPDGSCCMAGLIDAAVPELIGTLQLHPMAMVGMNLIETVNLNDEAGQHLDKWPLVAKPA